MGEISTSRTTADMANLAAAGEHAVKTGMLPEHIRTGWQFAVIAAAGHEMGMQPMRAIRSLAMVKGKVIEAADSQLARFKSAGGRSEFETLDETRAVLHLVHPNGDKHTETFTLDDAKRAGLETNANYKKFPRAMLRSRAITAGLKSIGWEGAVGAYDPDEIPVDAPTSPPIEYRPRPEPANLEKRPGVIRPGGKPEIERSPAEKARIAISSAKTIGECESIRSKLDKSLESGSWDDATHKELVKLLMGRTEILDVPEGE